VDAVLRAAGKTFADVIKTSVFLTDMRAFPLMNAVYERYFRGPITEVVLKQLVPDVWRRYWPEVVGLAPGGLWFGGYWGWQQWKRQQQRLIELERQASDHHVEQVVYKVLNQNTVFQRLSAVDQRVSRLEEWKLQGGGDTAEALAHRAIQSEIGPKRGGMDVKP
jgi:enamine deaminase RidA (YjgF/YER057c/UK114 family)